MVSSIVSSIDVTAFLIFSRSSDICIDQTLVDAGRDFRVSSGWMFKLTTIQLQLRGEHLQPSVNPWT